MISIISNLKKNMIGGFQNMIGGFQKVFIKNQQNFLSAVQNLVQLKELYCEKSRNFKN